MLRLSLYLNIESQINNEFDLEQNCATLAGNQLFNSLPLHVKCLCHSLNLVGSTDYDKVLKSSSMSLIKNLHQKSLKKCEKLWLSFHKGRNIQKVFEVTAKSYPFLLLRVGTQLFRV